MSAPITVLPHASVLASLITPSELAEALGTTERTLSEWRIRGSGPAYLRIGRSVRYVPLDVDSWLLAQQHRSTAEELTA